MEEEHWVELEWFPNYRISDLGRVWNIKRDYFLKPVLTIGGYHKVVLSADGRQYSFFLHRLVAEAFYGPQKHLVVNHIDGNKTNNNVENLEWMTQKENMRHAHDSPFVTSPGIPPIAIKIIELNMTFRSLADCARYLGCSPGPIRRCLRENKSYMGYTFECV